MGGAVEAVCEMIKLYAVFEGDYSNRRLIGIMSTPENRDELCRLYRTDDVEEFDMDTVPEHPPGLLAWTVLMERSGDCQVHPQSPDNMKEVRSLTCSGKKLYCYVWARDKEHAAKIANEMRAVAIAECQV